MPLTFMPLPLSFNAVCAVDVSFCFAFDAVSLFVDLNCLGVMSCNFFHVRLANAKHKPTHTAPRTKLEIDTKARRRSMRSA